MTLANPEKTLSYLRAQKQMTSHNLLCYSESYLMDKPRGFLSAEWEKAKNDCDIVDELIQFVQRTCSKVNNTKPDITVYFDVPDKRCTVCLQVEADTYNATKLQVNVSNVMGAPAFSIDETLYISLTREYKSTDCSLRLPLTREHKGC